MDPVSAAAASEAVGTTSGVASGGTFLGTLGTIGSAFGSAGSFLNGLNALGGMFGGDSGPSPKRQIKRAENMMRFQRDIQRDLRLSAYPDTVQSLKNAGLNPMLAYSNGVAQGGSVSPYTAPNTSSQNAQTSLMRMQKLSTAAQIANLTADTELKGSQADSQRLQQLLTAATTSGQTLDNFMKDIQVRRERFLGSGDNTQWAQRQDAQTMGMIWDTAVKANDAATIAFLNDYAKDRGFNTFDAFAKKQSYDSEGLRQELTKMQTAASKQGIDLRQYEIPELRNNAEFQTAIGQAGKIGSGAKATIDLLRALKMFFGK